MKSFVAYLLGTFLFLSAVNASTIWTSIGSIRHRSPGRRGQR